MNSSSTSITERSFYPAIIKLVEQVGERLGIKVAGVSEVTVGGKHPDIMFQLDTQRLLVQVKIDTVEKMIDDLVKTYPIASSRQAGLLLLLLPPEVRRIHPLELEKVAPVVRVKRAIALAPWISKHVEDIELENAIQLIIGVLKEYERVKKPAIDYLTIAFIAREAIEELAGILRDSILKTPRLLDQAQAIIGRFDFYRTLLSEATESEEVTNTYVADIIAYLTILSTLFLHVVSVKKYGRSVLPHINNPFQPPQNLLNIIDENIRMSGVTKDYQFVAEPLLYIINMLKSVEDTVRYTLTQYIYVLQVLKPEHVEEELFGRIYQEGLPPETRKNLGAFFTNPVAARLLAYLAVERWDEKILDPACGSGTLLTSAYEAKMEKALTQGVNRHEAHRQFLEKHIVGVDIMQFASKLTSINLALQDVETPVEPRVFWGDGVKKMVSAAPINDSDDPPQQRLMYEYFIERDRDSYLKYRLPREGFDTVIMNPPFTRRERIPKEERKELEKMLGSIVRGKVGYWAYFFVAADNVIKPGGKLAAVTPEEFFVGSSAESVRRYLFKGEVKRDGGWVKARHATYVPQIIVKSAVDVAFSEGALYRDYLVVFRKTPSEEARSFNKCVIVTLKKKLEELKGLEKEVAAQIKSLLQGSPTSISNEFFDAVRLDDITYFVERHVDNLKPLVAFSSTKALELLYETVSVESVKRLDEIAELRDYTCQYTGTGFEEYARRLFISKYETGASKLSFKLVSESEDSVKIKIAGSDRSFDIPKGAVVPSLRTYAGIKHMDVSGEEEYAIINPDVINNEYLRSAGLIDRTMVWRASNDIKKAYDEITGHILLTRRLQLTSPNVYWLSFYSRNKIIGPSAPMICLKLRSENLDYYKVLALYLNSGIAFLQLLAYLAMTRGAWVALHSSQVWSNVRVPDITSLPDSVLEEALQVFNAVAKLDDVQPLYARYTSKSYLQRKIDRVALKMLGLKWSNEQLNTLYDIIKYELDVMQRTLEESQKRKAQKRKRESEEEKSEDDKEQKTKHVSLNMWMRK